MLRPFRLVVVVGWLLVAATAASFAATPPNPVRTGPTFGSAGRGPLGGQYQSMGSSVIRRPVVSPYLNILRNDGLGPLNYQTLVRPQIEARNAFLRQADEMRSIESQLRNRRRPTDEPGQMRETGHGTSFFNYSHYFPGAGS